MTAALPCGNKFTATDMPRDNTQHKYIPSAAVYNSCGRVGDCDSSVAGDVDSVVCVI